MVVPVSDEGVSRSPQGATVSEEHPELAWFEGAQGEHISLTGNLSIGRRSNSDLLLDDPGHLVSRRHASIHMQGDQEFWCVDLGSTNGSFVNGHRVHQSVRLRNGDVLQVGSFRFVFRQPSGSHQTTVGGVQTIPWLECAECWLLVADVVNSTRLAQEMMPDELVQKMGGWFLRSKELLESQDGAINKYLGDGFLAYWRESDEGARQARQAIQSFQTLQERESLPFRFVVHFGKTWLGGIPSHGEDSLAGPAVTFVFGVEKVARDLGERCLVSEAAAARLIDLAELELCGEHPVRGFEGEYRFFRPV